MFGARYVGIMYCTQQGNEGSGLALALVCVLKCARGARRLLCVRTDLIVCTEYSVNKEGSSRAFVVCMCVCNYYTFFGFFRGESEV